MGERTGLLLAVLVGVSLYWAPVGAFLALLDPGAIDDAIAIGQTTIARDRRQFHERYRVDVARPPIDFIEVITPFRRVVIAAEAQARRGSRRFGQPAALAVLDAAPGHVTLRVELTFHPLHTYVGVPVYDVVLVRGDAVTEPLSVDRVPRSGVRTEGDLLLPAPQPVTGQRSSAQPMTGGTVIAVFDGRVLGADNAYDVGVRDSGKELARVRLALGTLR